MSAAAHDIHEVHAHGAHAHHESDVADGAFLPAPAHPTSAGVIAFAMAVPGAFTLMFFICWAVMAMFRGGGSSVLAGVVVGMIALWLPTTLISIWAAESRGEWG